MYYTTIPNHHLDIEARKADALFWSSILGRNPGVSKVFPSYADKCLGGDLFLSLFKFDPEIRDDPPNPAAAGFIEMLRRSPGWEQLHARCATDKYQAGAAAIRLYRELKRRPQSTGMSDVLEVMRHEDQIKTSPGIPKQMSEAMLSKSQEYQAELRESLPETVAERSQLSNLMATHAGESMTTVSEDLDAADKLSWAAGADMSVENRGKRLLELVTDETLVNKIGKQQNLRDVLKLLGRARKALATAKQAKPTKAVNVTGITVGNDLGSVLASELAMLGDEDMEYEFWSRYLEKSLLQLKREDQKKKEKGPFILCLDVSGSMHSTYGTYAKAAGLALMQDALKEKRSVGFLWFASYSTDVTLINDELDLVKFINHDYSGRVGSGTRFEPPLDTAVKSITANGSLAEADIVMLTDGVSDVSGTWLEQAQIVKKDTQFKVFGVRVSKRAWSTNMQAYLDGEVQITNPDDIKEFTWLHELGSKM
jgi:uncharacterized protein with von Willebrand factor type A (vWA) domain